ISRLRPADSRRVRRNGPDPGTLRGPTDRGWLYPTAMQRSGIVQCRRIVNVQITGLTHLREASRDGSLVRGSAFAEAAFPDSVAIDLDDIWDSRLGMNLHVAETPSYVWYRVVAHGGVPLDDRREVYLREGMFRAGTPSVGTPTVSVSSGHATAQSIEERAASI